MNSFYKTLNLIILGILILIFILYNITKTFNNDCINVVKEAFQVQESNIDINGVFFDLSANYFKLLDSEKAPQPPTVPDTIILDIGGAYGDYDASRIPWDAENKELSPSEALYGIVPSATSASLFNKVVEANQLADVGKLPYDEENNRIIYDMPVFDEDPTNIAKEDKDFDTAMQVTNFFGAMFISEFAETSVEKMNIRKGFTGALKAPFKLIDFLLLGSGSKAVSAGLRLLGREPKPVNPKKLAQKVDGQKTVVGNINKMSKEAGEKISKQISNRFGKIIAKRITQLTTKLLLTSIILSVSLTAIPPPWVGIALGRVYDFIVTPIILAVSMSGVVDGAIEKFTDEEGCCPPNSTPLDSVIPPLLNDLLIGNIPIIGDVLSFFYPYVCSENGTGRLVYKLSLTLPKYIKYPWLSCYYLNWPDYNCRVGGRAPINGKRLTGSSYDWNNSGLGAYTNLNDVIANPDNFKQPMMEMKMGKKVQTSIQFIVPSGKNFVYADFTEPKMLIDMAQFYYDWASKDYYPNDDGTVTIEYITKINYVAASSLYTCDVNCEMLSVTFDPISGKNYSETITYDRDRRFYYRVNTSNSAPNFWENSSDSVWRRKDDDYDLAINDLNSFIHQDRFNNKKLKAEVLTTAYRQMLDNSNRFLFMSNLATSNYAVTGPTGIYDNSLREFNANYIKSNESLSSIPRTYLSNFSPADETTLRNKLSTIIGLSNDLWQYHLSRPSSQPNVYVNYQYRLMGCTKVDSTASCAIAPDPTNLEEDARYFTNFNVLPYIKRCGTSYIDTTKCIDPSNIELVIYNYYLQNPNKRIKSINSIKAKGKNACEFVWDEITYNTVTKAETDFKKNVKTTILYQQDLSSCTFSLPPPVAISGTSNYLFGSQSNGNNNIISPPTSVKMFKNPLVSTSPNFSENKTLQYDKASFKFPIMPNSNENLPQNRPKSFAESNIDYVPRYDPATFKQLPDLIRPKKPIRIHYPNDSQSFLGNESNNYCSDPRTLSNIILNYNGDSNNINKITKIIRAFTSSSNTCDLEVDLYIKDSKKLERRTITTNVKREGFQNPFTFDSLNNESTGLNINTETDSLSNPYQLGFGYSDPYLRRFRNEIVPNTVYFNDNLVKNFTEKTKSMRNANFRILQGLVGTERLGGQACNKKCSDDDVVQRIIEQYNKDGTPKTRFDVKQDSVRQVVNSATNSSNTCHVIIDNKTEYYGDYYGDKSSSNYSSEFRLKLKKIEMENLGNCTFNPVKNQIYQDISASDLALTVSSNFNTYKTPVRVGCIPVNCRDSNLYNKAFNDYKSKTGNTVKKLLQSMNIGNNTCDYLIETELNIEDELLESDNYVLRVNYDNTLYQDGIGSNCSLNNSYNYKPNNFKLQVPLELSNYIPNTQYYEVQDAEGSNASPLLSYDGTSSDPIKPRINENIIRFS